MSATHGATSIGSRNGKRGRKLRIYTTGLKLLILQRVARVKTTTTTYPIFAYITKRKKHSMNTERHLKPGFGLAAFILPWKRTSQSIEASFLPWLYFASWQMPKKDQLK